MTDKEAMKLALDALETLMIERGSIYEKAIAALKEQLAQPEQEPMAWIHIDPDKPKVKFLEWKENEHGYRGRWIKKPLYLHPPQRTEQNFCERCGKRTPDLTHIHTCTPPKETT